MLTSSMSIPFRGPTRRTKEHKVEPRIAKLYTDWYSSLPEPQKKVADTYLEKGTKTSTEREKDNGSAAMHDVIIICLTQNKAIPIK